MHEGRHHAPPVNSAAEFFPIDLEIGRVDAVHQLAAVDVAAPENHQLLQGEAQKGQAHAS